MSSDAGAIQGVRLNASIFPRVAIAISTVNGKALGANLVDEIVRHVDGDLDHTVFSFIPNTAEVAFIGMVQGLEKVFDQRKMDAIQQALHDGAMTRGVLHG